MKKFITSSVMPSIRESVLLAKELNTGIEISRLPNVKYIDTDFDNIVKSLQNDLADFEGEKNLHGIFSDLNPAAKDLALREVVKRRFTQSFNAAKAIGAKTVVFHSGDKGMKHKVSIQNFIDNSIIFWSEFIKIFEDNGMTAVIENVLETNNKKLITIVDEVNSPNLKISLDTGHANLFSEYPDICDWIKTYKNRLYHMHLHNNMKTNDDHAGFKFGTLNFERIVYTLKEENLNPLIVFEMFNKQQLIDSYKMFCKYEKDD